MSNKTILTFSLLATVASAAFASNSYAYDSAVTPYVSGNAQFLFGQDDKTSNSGESAKVSNDDGYGLGVAVGAKKDNLRAEFEVNYLHNKVTGVQGQAISDISTSVYTYMGNAFYDFKNTTAFTPYLGAGIGVAHGKFYETINNTSTTDNTFAYQALAGVGYEVNKNNTVYAGYRYVGTEDFKTGATKRSFERNSLEAGYRYSF